MHDRIANRDVSGARRRRAFSLTELLVVIGIILITIVIGIPGIRAMFTAGRVESSAQAIAGTVAAARAYATRQKGFLTGDYSGVAVVLTPAGELRLVENIEDAKDGSSPAEPLELKDPPANGYDDIPDTQSVTISQRVGVVGLARGDDLKLYPPPFAVRFNENGMLVSAQNTSGTSYTRSALVYYDGDYDGKYEVSKDRATQRDISEWDPTSTAWDSNNYDTANGYELPFEVLETVIGVIIFDKEEWREAGHDWDNVDGDGVSGAARDWIIDSGIPLFFNRYTGTVNE